MDLIQLGKDLECHLTTLEPPNSVATEKLSAALIDKLKVRNCQYKQNHSSSFIPNFLAYIEQQNCRRSC